MLLLFFFFINCITTSIMYSQEIPNKENQEPIRFTIKNQIIEISQKDFSHLKKTYAKKRFATSPAFQMAPTILENILKEEYKHEEKEYKEMMTYVTLHEQLFHCHPTD